MEHLLSGMQTPCSPHDGFSGSSDWLLNELVSMSSVDDSRSACTGSQAPAESARSTDVDNDHNNKNKNNSNGQRQDQEQSSSCSQGPAPAGHANAKESDSESSRPGTPSFLSPGPAKS